jgi:hypothetical protein
MLMRSLVVTCDTKLMSCSSRGNDTIVAGGTRPTSRALSLSLALKRDAMEGVSGGCLVVSQMGTSAHDQSKRLS